MKTRGKLWIKASLFLFFLTMLFPVKQLSAKEVTIEVTEDGGEQELITGDSGKFAVPETIVYDGESKSVDSVRYSSSDEEVLSVNDDGTFLALEYGSARVAVSVYVKRDYSNGGYNYYSNSYHSYSYDDEYDDDDYYYDDDDYYDDDYNDNYTDYDGSIYDTDDIYCLFTAYYQFTVKPDLSGVTINKTEEIKYISEYDWGMPDFTFQLNSDIVLNESYYDDSYIEVSYQSSNSKISIDGSLENNVITLTPSREGKTNVTITINEKQFKVTIQTIKVSMTKNSLLMGKKQTKQLKIKGVKKGIKWSSTNAKVVKVSSSGKLKAKKIGNAVIKATIGDISLGCAVSVVAPGRVKVIKGAIKMAKTGTYSQEKRMQKGYYDCSSLTWRNYKKAGITLGNANYAPVAADQGKWCAKNKKLVKGGLSAKNVQNMKINAGDLMFETGSDNGRYRGIYHVEMVTGYACYGFYSNGKPILVITWASRDPGAYGCMGQMVGRP